MIHTSLTHRADAIETNMELVTLNLKNHISGLPTLLRNRVFLQAR